MMGSSLHSVQACAPWQRLKISEHTGKKTLVSGPFRMWVGALSGWSNIYAIPWFSQPQIYPGSLPILKFCPFFSMVRWTAAALGPKVPKVLSVYESFIIGWEWMNFANHKVSQPPELVTWKPQRENAIPFHNVLLAQLLFWNINWQKVLHTAPSAQVPCWIGGCRVWSSEQQKGGWSSSFEKGP